MYVKPEAYGYSIWAHDAKNVVAQIGCDKSGSNGFFIVGRQFSKSEIRGMRKHGVCKVS